MVYQKILEPHSMQVLISHANPAEVNVILDILNKATEWLASRGMQHWNGVHSKENVLADFDRGHVLIARFDNQEIVGTIAISFVPPSYYENSDKNFWKDSNARAAYMRKLAIVPAHMKKGIASKLLSAAEIDAVNSGACYARLDSNPAFPELIPYYLNRGYTKKGEREGSSFFEKELSRL